MSAVFADTFYFLGLLNATDEANDRCVAFTERWRGRLVTTEFVLLELADAFAAPPNRARVVSFLHRLRQRPDVTVVSASAELMSRGVVRFEERADKDWPLTDCISFVVMEELGLTEAAAGDQHFVQAGFRALLL
jgi:hypothetical protein